MKRIFLIILCLIFVLLLTGCSNENPMYHIYNDNIFTVVEDGKTHQIMRHNQTGVLYLYVFDSNSAGITVMLNPDGKPMVMEETEP